MDINKDHHSSNGPLLDTYYILDTMIDVGRCKGSGSYFYLQGAGKVVEDTKHVYKLL